MEIEDALARLAYDDVALVARGVDSGRGPSKRMTVRTAWIVASAAR
jgi:hypothetical protein